MTLRTRLPARWVPLLFVCLIAACSDRSPPRSPGTEPRRLVYTDNYPLEYFAQRIGGEFVEVRFPGPPEQDPAFWEPGAAEIEAYQKADLILLNGAGYAKWVDRASLPPRKVVDTSAAFRGNLVELPDVVTHSHGPEGPHTHAGLASTTWIDFTQAMQQAEAVYNALRGLMPGEAVFLQTNYDRLHTDLEAFDVRLDTALAPLRGQPLLASHPVFQYLARRYGLDLESVHWEHNEMPGESDWTQLKDRLDTRPARFMIWEGEPMPEIRIRLARLRVVAVVFDPCANRPPSGDFLSVMEENLANIMRVSH